MKPYLPLLIYVVVFLFSVKDTLSADVTVGKLTNIRGVVTIKRANLEKPIAAVLGSDFFIGDVVQTGKDSRAQLTFADNSFVNLASETVFMAIQYIYEPENNRRKAIVKILGGKARFILHKEGYRDSSFAAEAGNALITTNTADFAVTVLSTETEVVVFNKTVSTKNILSLVVGEIKLGTNQMTIIKEKTTPSKPAALTSKQRIDYIRATK